MIPGYIEFKELCETKCLKMLNNRFNKTMQNFNIIQILKDEIFDLNINQKIKESKAIIIDTCFILSKEYVIICFKNQLIIFEKILSYSNNFIKRLMKTLFSQYNEDKLYILYHKTNQNKTNFLEEEIFNFNSNFKIYPKHGKNVLNFWKIIQTCLSAYFIKKSYIINDENRLNSSSKNETKKFDENEFITLRIIGLTNSSTVNLCYHIESEQIFVIKKFYKEIEKLELRETENYKKISFKFLPKLYGQLKTSIGNSLVIEFLNGQTLKFLSKKNLNFKQKVLIVIDILETFQYLHQNHFVYRDLKPDNLILDSNNHIVLIDFDKMIQEDEVNVSTDFASLFVDPEMSKEKYVPSCLNDIYSIGKIIQYIFNKDCQFKNIQEIYEKCICEDPMKIPSITELIVYFNTIIFTINNPLFKIKKIGNNKYHISFSDNFIEQIENYSHSDTKSSFLLDITYYEGINVKQDIDKAIYYFTNAANQNDLKSQFYLGLIYSNNKYNKMDLNKSIYYYKLSADQNYELSQYNLGLLYYKQEYSTYDINKCIYYLTLAANQNNLNAQYNLGNIYYALGNIDMCIYYLTIAANRKYADAQYNLGIVYKSENSNYFDINKSIYYFTLAVNQNHQFAQFQLGLIYCEGKYVNYNEEKAVYYFNLAANQNNTEAQYYLGCVYYQRNDINKYIFYTKLAADQNNRKAQLSLGDFYYNAKFTAMDINKAIYYFSLAANQNDITAQYNLGVIYFDKKYINQDIHKSIYYLTLSANQNYYKAQFVLGFIYLNENLLVYDINKAIYYFTLSANQNFHLAQLYIGILYYEGIYIKQDICKGIHYLYLAANQNNQFAQQIIGYIYFEGKYVERDMSKSIHYLTSAADKNNEDAQILLGNIYIKGLYIQPDIEKAIYYFSLASNNHNNKMTQYCLGLIFYEGIYIKKDIEKTIYYLKKSAENKYNDAILLLGELYLYGKDVKQDILRAFNLFKKIEYNNNRFVKNNLGVIYKNGYKSIKKNIQLAKEYFNESIKFNNDNASLFNLFNILYTEEEEEAKKDHSESIKLLIKSSKSYDLSCFFLALVLVKKYGFIDLLIIQNELKLNNEESDELANNILFNFYYFLGEQTEVFDYDICDAHFNELRQFNLIYVNSKIEFIKEFKYDNCTENISEDFLPNQINDFFYEGFGIK